MLQGVANIASLRQLRDYIAFEKRFAKAVQLKWLPCDPAHQVGRTNRQPTAQDEGSATTIYFRDQCRPEAGRKGLSC